MIIGPIGREQCTKRRERSARLRRLLPCFYASQGVEGHKSRKSPFFQANLFTLSNTILYNQVIAYMLTDIMNWTVSLLPYHMLISWRPVAQLAMLFEEQTCPYLIFLLNCELVLYNLLYVIIVFHAFLRFPCFLVCCEFSLE